MKRKIADYVGGLLLSLFAVALTRYVPILDRIPWTPGFLAVAGAARIWGLGPAILATVVASWGTYGLILTSSERSSLHPAAVIETFVFAAGALLIAYMVRARDEVFASLAVSESHYRSVTETAADVIVTIDSNSTILAMNPSVKKVFGYEPEEVLGKSLLMLMPEFYRPGHLHGISTFIKTRQREIPWTGVQLAGLRKDGEEVPIEISFGSYAVEGETRFTGFIRDISERRAAHAALVQSEKLAAVGRLSSSIAHEINNPLEAVTNLIYISRESEDVSEIHDLMEVADRELRRISVITNQTLLFHKQSEDPVAVAGADLLDGLLKLYHGRFANAKVSVRVRQRSQRHAVCVEGQIRQVLSNLIGNAIDALTGDSKSILLRTRDGVDWKTGRAGVILTVADSGTGMSPQTRTKIFDPFFTTKGVGGAGLGLWISRQMVEQNEGGLRVRSSQKSGCSGTVFALFLPSE